MRARGRGEEWERQCVEWAFAREGAGGAGRGGPRGTWKGGFPCVRRTHIAPQRWWMRGWGRGVRWPMRRLHLPFSLWGVRVWRAGLRAGARGRPLQQRAAPRGGLHGVMMALERAQVNSLDRTILCCAQCGPRSCSDACPAVPSRSLCPHSSALVQSKQACSSPPPGLQRGPSFSRGKTSCPTKLGGNREETCERRATASAHSTRRAAHESDPSAD